MDAAGSEAKGQVQAVGCSALRICKNLCILGPALRQFPPMTLVLVPDLEDRVSLCVGPSPFLLQEKKSLLLVPHYLEINNTIYYAVTVGTLDLSLSTWHGAVHGVTAVWLLQWLNWLTDTTWILRVLWTSLPPSGSEQYILAKIYWIWISRGPEAGTRGGERQPVPAGDGSKGMWVKQQGETAATHLLW